MDMSVSASDQCDLSVYSLIVVDKFVRIVNISEYKQRSIRSIVLLNIWSFWFDIGGIPFMIVFSSLIIKKIPHCRNNHKIK